MQYHVFGNESHLLAASYGEKYFGFVMSTAKN